MQRIKSFTKLITFIFVLILSVGMFSTVEVKAAELNKTSAKIYIGGSTLELKLTGTTAKTWATSDKKIADVSSKGVVTAKGVGSAKITCKGKDGKTYSCKVVVRTPYLNATSQEIHVEKTFTLKLVGVKVKSFSSSNSAIAQVSSKGVITGVKAGTAKITVVDVNKKTYTCNVTVTDHQKVSSNNAVSATCTEPGKKSDTECSICAKKLSIGKAIPATGHKMKSKISAEPTCSTYGKIKNYCKICRGNISYEKIPKTAHNLDTRTIQPTCSYDGYTEEYCTVCEEVVSRVDIPALEHDWELKLEIEANCERGTQKYYTCKTCFVDKTETLDDAIGHDFSSLVVDKYLCVQDGYTLLTCENCGMLDEIRQEAPGHDYVLSEDGKSIICQNCNSVFTATLSDSVKDGKLYFRQNMNIAIGQTLTVDGELINPDSYGYYEFNKSYLDFWQNIRIELSNTDCVEIYKHDYQTGYQISPTETVNIDQQDVLRTKDFGSSHVKIYFHDILFDEFDIYVGATIVDGIKAIMNGQSDANIFAGYSELQIMNVNAVAEMLNNTIYDGMSDYQKIVAIQNWYKENVNYMLTGARSDSISEIFLNHQGQCEDYAETFGLLMEVLGIESYYIAGQAYKLETTDGHAWNIVKVDAGNGKGAQWYYADMTWDDFVTDKSVPELNTEAGYGRYDYSKVAGTYRMSEIFLKLRPTDYSNDTEPYAAGEDNEPVNYFTDFVF